MTLEWITSLWMRLSYSLELLIAGVLFALPVRKRRRWPLILAADILGMLALSYLAAAVFQPDVQEITGLFDVVQLFYWLLYLGPMILFFRSLSEVKWLDAVYCALWSCTTQHIAFDVFELFMLYVEVSGAAELGLRFLCYLVTYAAVWFLLIPRLLAGDRYDPPRAALVPMLLVSLTIWPLSVLDSSELVSFQASDGSHIIYRLADITCCIFALWMQVCIKVQTELQRNLDGVNYAWQKQTEQYRIVTQTIESINRKCHDLKYNLRAMQELSGEDAQRRYYDEIKDQIMIYDTALQTGNRALDTVLMDKGLFCKDHQIAWTCMTGGIPLDFLSAEDIYAMFGNALDNAIEAVLPIEEEDKRVINVRFLQRNNLYILQFQNYYVGELKFRDGLPATTKADKSSHGFGMKSIASIARKYDGTVTVHTEDQIFTLQIFLQDVAA